MRLGYSYWGFLGDFKIENGESVSTPDGNATYSWSIIHEAQRRGWEVYAMQKDRDREACEQHHDGNFSAFSWEKRLDAYVNLKQTEGVLLPELDVLLVEWRFPISGRNTPDMKGKPGYQPDLERQRQLLNHYADCGTKVILWDLDQKLTYEDEDLWSQCYDAIFETSVRPLDQHFHRRVRIEPPTVVDDLLQFPTLPSTIMKKLVYVGSRYERDDVIDQYIKPASSRWPYNVHFYGNWLKTLTECQERWPKVKYHDRITTTEFRQAYGDAVACPIIGKRSYFQTGFITPRPWEALLFGTLPVGFDEHLGVDDYVYAKFKTGEDLAYALPEIQSMSLVERNLARQEMAHKLRFMDARYFVDKIEQVVNGSSS